ncbi:MAG: hypothetical protein HC781_05880 [Leptolyngbyaceae cyanobacterium CSU_1_4]|nr:hypothetical protein [Leptolyngbyaceae cyanobacterium CSU_1_4]
MDKLDQYREILYKILSQYTPLMSKSACETSSQENRITSTVIVNLNPVQGREPAGASPVLLITD